MTASRHHGMLAVFLAICFGAAALAGLTTASSVHTWYPTLAKPAWTPPSWLFGPVWTVLYAALAVSAWLVYRRAGLEHGKAALCLFALQLASIARQKGWLCDLGLSARSAPT